MRRVFFGFWSFCALAVVAACGSSTSETLVLHAVGADHTQSEASPQLDIIEQAPIGDEYEPLPIADGYTVLGAVFESTQSSVAGNFLVQSADDAALYSALGTVTHDTGALKFKVGNYTFKNKTGFSESGELTDKNGVILTLFETNPSARFATLYTARTNDPSIPATGFGIIGIPTNTADMPELGTASYQGNGRIGMRSASRPGFDADAIMSGNVDFRSKLMTVSVSAIDAPASVAFDQIVLSDVEIRDAAARGGNFSIYKEGSSVSPVGAVVGAISRAQFYGGVIMPDGTVAPAELGGSALIKGGEGVAFSTFLGSRLRE